MGDVLDFPAPPMRITIRRAGRGYEVLTSGADGRSVLYGRYATRPLAVAAQGELERVRAGVPAAAEVAGAAVQTLARASGLPDDEALELLIEALNSWRRPA